MATDFSEPDWDQKKDEFTICGFDGTDKGGKFTLHMTPDLYEEGDCFTLEDFLSQYNVGTGNALYYITFLSYNVDSRSCGTVIGTGKEKDSYTYFNDINVEILKKDAGELVLYFYLEVDSGVGAKHQLEGLISTAISETDETVSEHKDGSCPDCGGSGTKTCTTCGGKGQVKCSKCSGSGKNYSAATKKKETCSRCGGTGKQFCGFCTNGKQTCDTCGGSGKAQ